MTTENQEKSSGTAVPRSSKLPQSLLAYGHQRANSHSCLVHSGPVKNWDEILHRMSVYQDLLLQFIERNAKHIREELCANNFSSEDLAETSAIFLVPACAAILDNFPDRASEVFSWRGRVFEQAAEQLTVNAADSAKTNFSLPFFFIFIWQLFTTQKAGTQENPEANKSEIELNCLPKGAIDATCWTAPPKGDPVAMAKCIGESELSEAELPLVGPAAAA